MLFGYPMFETLHALRDNALLAREQIVFVNQQNDLLEINQTQMIEEAALPLHAQNVELLRELQTVGDVLELPDMVEKLNTGLQEHPAVQDWQAYIEPISWVPHAPAALDENLAPADGVRAIHGWHLQWHGPKDSMMPQMALLLYQAQKEGTLEPPRAAVTTMWVESSDKKSTFGFRDMLEKETLVLSALKELCVTAHHPFDAVTERAKCLRFIADTKAMRQARLEPVAGQKAAIFLTGRDDECWNSRIEEHTNPMNPKVLSGIYEEMRLAVLKGTFSLQAYEKLFPSDSSPDNVLQSFNLPGINSLFAQPTTQKKWLGMRKITTDGGYIGERSWDLGYAVTFDPSATREKIADKVGRLSWRRFFRHILGHPEE